MRTILLVTSGVGGVRVCAADALDVPFGGVLGRSMLLSLVQNLIWLNANVDRTQNRRVALKRNRYGMIWYNSRCDAGDANDDDVTVHDESYARSAERSGIMHVEGYACMRVCAQAGPIGRVGPVCPPGRGVGLLCYDLTWRT